MKSSLLLFVACLLAQAYLYSQPDNKALIQEVEKMLSSKQASPSQILSDKKFDSVHPETSFRDLIKKYSNGTILKIVNNDEPGKKIKVIGTVKNETGQPVAGALVYLYQTDSRGWYAASSPHVQAYEGDFRHARLFGYLMTDANGQFELHTVKPSGYPRSDLPAHIHVHVSKEGYSDYGTEFLFDDDPRLVGKIRENSIRNRFIIAKPEKTSLPFDQQFSYQILMEK